MILNEIEKKEFDNFVYSHKNGVILQTSGWAQVKDNWKSEYVILRDDENKIKGTCLALIRKFPYLNYSLVYCPCGPVCDYTDYDTLTKIHNQLLQIAKKHHAVSIKIDTQTPITNDEYAQFMKSLGYSLKNDYYDFEGVQYRFTVRVNIGVSDEEIMANFKRKTRYAMKTALEHCKTWQGTRDDIEIFHKLMNATAEKHDFARRPKEYFYKLYDSFAPDHCAVFLSGDDEDILSATICMVCGETAMYLYGANAPVKQKLGANYAVQMEMYRWARQKGAKWFDMCGIPAKPEGKHAGLHIFKTKFGDICEYIGEFDYICKPFGNFLFVTGKKNIKYLRRLTKKKNLEKAKEE